MRTVTYNLQKCCKNNIVLILYEKLNQTNPFCLVQFKDELLRVTGRRTQLGYASSTNLLLSACGNCFAGSNVPLYVHNGLIYLFLSYAVSMYAASTNFDTIAYCICSDNTRSYLKITLQSNDSRNPFKSEPCLNFLDFLQNSLGFKPLKKIENDLKI